MIHAVQAGDDGGHGFWLLHRPIHMLNNSKMNFVLNENAELFFHFPQFSSFSLPFILHSASVLPPCLSHSSASFHCFATDIVLVAAFPCSHRCVQFSHFLSSTYRFQRHHFKSKHSFSLPPASTHTRLLCGSSLFDGAHIRMLAARCVFTVYQKGILNANDQFH